MLSASAASARSPHGPGSEHAEGAVDAQIMDAGLAQFAAPLLILAMTVAALLTLTATTAPSPLGQPGSASVGVAASPECHRVAPATADEYNRAFEEIPGGWLGGDQTTTTRLPDGRTLWVFADTLWRDRHRRAKLHPGVRLAHSPFVLQHHGCFAPVSGPGRGPVIADPGDGTWYWPQQAVVDGDRLWVTLLHVAGVYGRGLEFQLLGADLAEFSLRPGGEPEYVATHPTPASDAGDFGVLWGASLARSGDMLLVYGTRRMQCPCLGKELLLATVAASEIADPYAWRYRTDFGWSDMPAEAAVLYPAEGGVSTAFSTHLGSRGWTLVTKRGEFLGNTVITLTATEPWGPFLSQDLLYSPSVGSHITYLPMAHHDVPLSDGSLLVSINHNDLRWQHVLNHPEEYGPEFTGVFGLD